ncbi:Nif11-like leader peptide family natural product precursor [Chlorobaculum thiosulfatiphilum]|uniref:Nif11-like leader peptide family natural product n=1 Tax=Chlorobaculum thiosulfatiphilum TaxID=115852 RepID=A0A5C4S9W6_CHLTI|nr:Nif11-like leader peptide family RiPP precursor [Chlorobaculum thiosulfatiphilum]TNJ40350.1 Nif11-like leader peptide family natural product precursor [Chlorobaculum thiosulfatiphilum]
MSISSARMFLDKLMAEEDLGIQMAGELSRKRMELIRQAGFEFTDKELEQAKASLSPGALGHVAGWLCELPFDNQVHGRSCGGGLWH